MREKVTYLLNLLLPYFVLYLIGGLLSLPIVLFKTSETFDVLYKDFVYVLLFFISIFIFKNKFYFIYQRLLTQLRRSLFKNLCYACLLFLLCITIGVCFTFFLDGAELIDYGANYINGTTIISNFFIVGIFSNLLISFLEELLFRGFLINYIRTFVKSIYIPILVSALIFSFGHTYSDNIAFFIALVGGIVLAYGYLTTNSISFCVGIHFAYNLYNYTFTSALLDNNKYIPRPFIIRYSKFYTTNIDTIDISILLAFGIMLFFLYYLHSKLSRRLT